MKKYFTLNDDFIKIIETRFPKHKKIEQISTGWTNYVFVVKSKKGCFIFRFPRNTFFSNALVKECRFLTQIKKENFNVILPNIELNFYNGRPYSIHRLIKGKSLTDSKLSEKQKIRFSKQICEFLEQLSKIKTNMKLGKTSTFLKKLAIASAVEDYNFNEHNVLIKEEKKHLVLSHADFNPGNLIIRKGKLVAVLDFAFVSYSSPINDLARLVGRADPSYRAVLIKEFEKKFGEIDEQVLNSLIKMWTYVETSYIKYIKQKHPDIILPDNIF